MGGVEGGWEEGGVCLTTTIVDAGRVGLEPQATFFDLSDSKVVEAKQVGDWAVKGHYLCYSPLFC